MSIKPVAMRDVFLERVWRGMQDDPRIFLVSADFGSPVLDKIRADHAARFVNVGIAEQNLINVSAGLALEGYTVFAYAIAPFITMRCYEQTRVSLALLSELRPMNVNLVGVGAGYSYVVSGPTHQCYEDITLMRAMPNMRVLSPADHVAAAAMFDTCIGAMGPKYLRFDAQVLPVIYEAGAPPADQGFQRLRKGQRVCLAATGFMVHTAMEAANRLAAEDGVQAGVLDVFDLSRCATDALARELAGYDCLVTLEEGFRGRGGLDALLLDFVAGRGGGPAILNLGVEGGYRFELGTRTELHEQVGIGLQAVLRRVRAFLASRDAGSKAVDKVAVRMASGNPE